MHTGIKSVNLLHNTSTKKTAVGLWWLKCLWEFLRFCIEKSLRLRTPLRLFSVPPPEVTTAQVPDFMPQICLFTRHMFLVDKAEMHVGRCMSCWHCIEFFALSLALCSLQCVRFTTEVGRVGNFGAYRIPREIAICPPPRSSKWTIIGHAWCHNVVHQTRSQDKCRLFAHL